MEPNFFIRLSIQTISLFLIAFLCGLLVKHKNVKVNYTRKINHFLLFFLPMFLASILTYKETPFTSLFSMVFAIGTLILYLEPIRSKIKFFETAFLSFDRPEDRPHTLLWLTTQSIAGWVVMIPLSIYLTSIGRPDLMLIPVLINGIGDGLAEPVGVRFGKRKYKTRAIFSKRTYERSIEGSMCVFVVSIIALLLFNNNFTTQQFILGLIVIPVLMTVAEAKSPHTWDTPVLFFVAGISLIGILHI